MLKTIFFKFMFYLFFNIVYFKLSFNYLLIWNAFSTDFIPLFNLAFKSHFNFNKKYLR